LDAKVRHFWSGDILKKSRRGEEHGYGDFDCPQQKYSRNHRSRFHMAEVFDPVWFRNFHIYFFKISPDQK
jgi:hypothetical protein